MQAESRLTRPAGLAALAFTIAVACRPAPSEPVLTEDHVARNNRGVGLMGQYAYEEAEREFAALARELPGWLDVQVNLAVALLNRQGAPELAEAERILRERVLVSDPAHRRGRYVLALLLLYNGRHEEALPHFRAVAEADPPDAHAAYFAARSLADAGSMEEALAWYRRAIAIEPRLRSAYYGAFQALQRLGRGDEGRPLLQTFEELGRNPQALTAEYKYTRMGPLAEAATVDLRAATPPAAPSGPAFAAAAPLDVAGQVGWRTARAPERPSITVVDLDGDGQLDVFLVGARSGGRPNAVLMGRPGGALQAHPDHPLAAVEAVRAAVWGDYDNDGAVDVFLCRARGGSQLWRQTAPGEWRDVTREAGIAAPEEAVDAAMFDADHDGDLDIWLLHAARPDQLLNNNGNGTFRDIAAQAGVAGSGRGSRGLAVGDLDGDRDADVVILRNQPPHDVFLNDRLWRYRRAAGIEAFAGAALEAALVGDADANGRPEIYTDGPRGLERWTLATDGGWRPASLAVGVAPSTPRQLALADVDGNGTLDLVASRGASWVVIDPLGGPDARVAFEAGGEPLAAWTVAALDAAKGPSVLALRPAGPPLVWRPGPGRQAFVALAFTGRDRASDQLRSNTSGIGVSAAVRTGSRWTAINTWRGQSGPGQSLQPIAVGLDGRRQADFVAMTWSDGVFQTELALAAGALHRIEETQRQLSSCPVLFAFDGRAFRFVTDVLGVGGIGFLERPGVYGEPFPREHVLLPAWSAAPKDGRYQIKIGEPMEEVAYLDAVWLSVYDLPPGVQMTLDERKAIAGPAPTGEPRFFWREVRPSRATTDRGEDVTALLAAADLAAAPPGRLDPRFIGRTDPWAVTLEFATPIDDRLSPLLVLDGWIEYPYAQTIFAAWQARAPYRAPTLEARDAAGRWHTVLAEFGYPAGMPRQMSVPLPLLPRGTTALRLSTTQEIYWDRAAIAYPDPTAAARVRHVRLPVAAARLDEVGFARRTTGPQRTPHYDYGARTPLWDTRHPRGWYTAVGPIEPLVADEDSALAIFGPGEEVHLEFEALPPPPPGWTRRLVLELRGWCKDMDLYTKDGETVEPLPGADSSARARLHPRFNTRFRAGY